MCTSIYTYRPRCKQVKYKKVLKQQLWVSIWSKLNQITNSNQDKYRKFKIAYYLILGYALNLCFELQMGNNEQTAVQCNNCSCERQYVQCSKGTDFQQYSGCQSCNYFSYGAFSYCSNQAFADSDRSVVHSCYGPLLILHTTT